MEELLAKQDEIFNRDNWDPQDYKQAEYALSMIRQEIESRNSDINIKESSNWHLKDMLKDAQNEFDKTGFYVRLASVSYEINQRQQTGKW